MLKKIEKDGDVWRLRIEMTGQLIWQAIKKMGENSHCPELQKVVRVQWFGGFHPVGKRMLPNGDIVNGAPIMADLDKRNDIVSEVMDGLKQRPREGKDKPCARFLLDMYEYDILLALTDIYAKGNAMINSEIDPYEAGAFETCAYTLLHVARADEDIKEAALVKDLGEEDYDACTI